MNILLIDPNIEGRVGEPPLNIAILKAVICESQNHEAKILDITFHKKHWRKYIKSELEKNKYDIVGISCLSFNINQGYKVAEFIKTHFDLPVIFGGIHIILMPEEVIHNEFVDIICTGEGEYPLLELMNNNLNPYGIKGLWYKSQGEVIKNPDRELIEDLDVLPFPDWSDFDMQKYFMVNGNLISLMASRGCPYPCTYCSNHVQGKIMKGKWVRYRSADNFIKEIELRIEQYYDKGLKVFEFNDDIFILNKNFFFDFCNKYREKNFHKKVLWTTTVRANLVTEDIARTMKISGCYEAGMGVESSNDHILNDVYKRGMTINQIEKAINILKKYKLQLHIPIIIGSPYDTIDIMEDNLQFMKKINPECMLFPILMPLPKTEILDICKKENLLEEEGFKSSHMMHTKPVIKTKYVSRPQVQQFVSKVRYFLIRHYFLDGLRKKHIIFLWDLFLFLVYYMRKYQMEIDNAWRFINNKYNIQKHRKEMINNNIFFD